MSLKYTSRDTWGGRGSGFRWSSDERVNAESLIFGMKLLQFLEEIFPGPSKSLTSNKESQCLEILRSMGAEWDWIPLALSSCVTLTSLCLHPICKMHVTATVSKNYGEDWGDTCNPPTCMLSHISPVWLLVTLWTIAHQAPLLMGFSRQEYWDGLPFPSPGDLPNPGIKCWPLAL